MTVTINNVTKYYGATLILDKICANIAPGDRIGLVGRNGAGKTTLLKLIAGAELCDEGAIETPRSFSTGYLDQEVSREFGGTVRNYLLPALGDLLELGTKLREMERQMAEKAACAEELEALMSRYAHLANQFEMQGGYEIEAKIKRTVQGLGLDYEELDRPLASLSGGERVRVGLVRLLLSEPDLLLLDEPTNHLDLKAIEWLEDYLSESKSALIVVSHDRYFLDRVSSWIWEIDRKKMQRYRGNYTAYLRQREEQRERQLRMYEQQQAEIEKLESYVRRYMAGNRSTMAKSRLKRLERIDRVERPADEKGLRFSFDPAKQTGKLVYRAEDLAKKYEEKLLFEEVCFDVYRGDRLGIVGPNGAGKTTLLSILAGRIEPTKGEVTWGHQVEVGYYSQTLEDLNEESSILEEVLAVRNLPIGEMRSFLAGFLFFEDEVFTKVKVLSGGEKARLALAKLLLSDANTLLLDEPTNHLDIDARNALEEALLAFPGTIVMVSHDRYFLDRVATRILRLEDGQVRFYEGNYTAFREAAAWEKRSEALGKQGPSGKPDGGDAASQRDGAVGRKTRPMPSAKQNRQAKAVVQRREGLEAQIEALEEELDDLQEKLGDPALYQDGVRAQEMVAMHRRVEDELAELYNEWEQLVEELNSSGENV